MVFKITNCTPWKMKGWNLQPSPMKRKEKDLNQTSREGHVPAVNLQGCNPQKMEPTGMSSFRYMGCAGNGIFLSLAALARGYTMNMIKFEEFFLLIQVSSDQSSLVICC